MVIAQMDYYLKYFLLALIGIINLVYGYGIVLYFRGGTQQRIVLFLLVLSVIGIGPFLLLPEHVAPYYASFAYIGVVGICAYGLESVMKVAGKHSLYIGVIFLSMYLGVQTLSINWTHQTHWLFARARKAKELIAQKNLTHPVASEEYYALGADAAYRYFNYIDGGIE